MQHLKLKSSICLKNYLFLSGNHKTATKLLKRGILEECLLSFLASNRITSGIMYSSVATCNYCGKIFQNKSLPCLKRYCQISTGRHISTVARYIPSYRPTLPEPNPNVNMFLRTE